MKRHLRVVFDCLYFMGGKGELPTLMMQFLTLTFD